MAEEAPKVQNKGLLLVALALGAIVVVIYNVHINAVRMEGKGTVIHLVELTTGKNVGDPIDEKDIRPVAIEKASAEKLGNVVTWDKKGFVVGRKITEQVQQGQWLLWQHLTAESQMSTWDVPRGTVVLTIPISPDSSPGPLLKPGGYVNLTGQLALAGKPPRFYRIIHGVKVRATGANLIESAAENPLERARNASRSYRTISIDLDEKVSLQWQNIASRISEVRVEVLPPNSVDTNAAGRINPNEPDLVELSKTAMPKLGS